MTSGAAPRRSPPTSRICAGGTALTLTLIPTLTLTLIPILTLTLTLALTLALTLTLTLTLSLSRTLKRYSARDESTQYLRRCDESTWLGLG